MPSAKLPEHHLAHLAPLGPGRWQSPWEIIRRRNRSWWRLATSSSTHRALRHRQSTRLPRSFDLFRFILHYSSSKANPRPAPVLSCPIRRRPIALTCAREPQFPPPPPPPWPATPPPPGSGYPYGGGAYGAPEPYGQKPPKEGKTSPSGSDPYHGAQQPYGGGGYGVPAAPYGQKPPKEGKTSGSDPYYGAPPPQQPYGGGYGAPAAPYGQKPPKEGKTSGSDPYHGAPPQQQPYGGGGGYGAPPAGQQPYGGGGYGSPFAALVPSAFPPGTDPNVVACFQAADRDGSGMIDDKELQSALSGYSSFSLRTVHLLMYLFTNTNVRKIGPKEFTSVFYSLQNWRGIFDRFDRDRSGKIDAPELRDALLDLGYSVSPTVLDLLVSKFDKTGGKNKAVEYDNFIECCLTVKGLTEKFKEKDMAYSGSATFGYEAFMLTVLPFLVA